MTGELTLRLSKALSYSQSGWPVADQGVYTMCLAVDDQLGLAAFGLVNGRCAIPQPWQVLRGRSQRTFRRGRVKGRQPEQSPSCSLSKMTKSRQTIGEAPAPCSLCAGLGHAPQVSFPHDRTLLTSDWQWTRNVDTGVRIDQGVLEASELK
jgi:hypothetical protein